MFTGLKFTVLMVVLFSLVFVFQDCGSDNFSFTQSIPSNAVLVAAPNTTSTTQTLCPADSSSTCPTSFPKPSPTSSPSTFTAPTPTCSGESCNPKFGAPASSADLVECELSSPNSKIVLSTDLKIGSNEVSTRLCMSVNACLSLVNAYAAARNCEISAGAANVSAAQATCTEIFPGSQGTCKNARVISDEEVTNLLTNMANIK